MNKDTMLKPAVVLTLFALASAVLMGFTYAITHGQIAERLAQAEITAYTDLLPDTHSTTHAELDYQGSSLTRIARSYNANGEFIGHIISANPSGYGGEIQMMVAFDPQGIIQGMRVIRHTETPGIGSVIAEDWFAEQFAGRTGHLISTRGAQGPQEIDMVANATISVNAILKGVNDATAHIGQGDTIGETPAAPDFPSAPPDHADMLPGAHRSENINMSISYDASGTVIGYIFYVSPQGYAGPIEMAVAMDTQGTIQGVKIIQHSETPTFGGLVIDDERFIEQFKGRSGEQTIVNNATGPQEVDAIAMATITVEAVIKGINQAITHHQTIANKG